MSRWFRLYAFADVAHNLLVGAMPSDADDVAALQRVGVRRVMNLVNNEEYASGARDAVREAYETAGIQERRLRFADHGDVPPTELEAAVRLVVGWLDQDLPTYVHCRAGKERSVCLAAAVLAVREGIEPAQALVQIKRRKPSADPLPHQLADLGAWWRYRLRLAAVEERVRQRRAV